MECMKSIYHILVEKLRKQKSIMMVTACAPDGSVVKTLEAPQWNDEGRIRLLQDGQGGLKLYERFARRGRLIILGDGETAQRLTETAAGRFAVIVADEAPDIGAHLPQAHLTLCDALASAARCLHITDQDSIVLAAKRYEEAQACIELLWEEAQPAFLGMVLPVGQEDWLERLRDDGIAEDAWLSRITAAELKHGAGDAAQIMMNGIERVKEEMNLGDENSPVIDFLSRLPAERIGHRHAVLTVVQAENEALAGRKMVLFEDGVVVGQLDAALEGETLRQAEACMQHDGWTWIRPNEQTLVLAEME